MPSIAATPNSEMKPTAAETLKFRPATQSPRMPPATANGMLESASRLSRIELNRLYSSIRISSSESGTISASRFLASCSAPNSPDHSRK